MEDLTRETIISDLEVLIKLNLVEVVGINDEGDFLYGATEYAKSLSEDEITSFLSGALEDE